MSIKNKKKKIIYKDGKYTGDLVDVLYGNLQIQVIIKNGKLKDIEYLDYPKDNYYSNELNNKALPQLKQEAVNAQNSNIDVVSGATETSDGFIKSLGSALSKAI